LHALLSHTMFNQSALEL